MSECTLMIPKSWLHCIASFVFCFLPECKGIKIRPVQNSTHEIYRPMYNQMLLFEISRRGIFLNPPPTKLCPPDIISFRTTGYWNRCCGSARSALAPEIRLLWFRLFSLGHLLVNLTSEPWWCQAGKLSSALPHICDTADLLSFLFSLSPTDPRVYFLHTLDTLSPFLY